MAQETAVEWLENNIPDISHYIPMGVTLEVDAKFQEAERMHKEQIIDAYANGYNNGYCFLYGDARITGEEYFEETYKTQAQ